MRPPCFSIVCESLCSVVVPFLVFWFVWITPREGGGGGNQVYK